LSTLAPFAISVSRIFAWLYHAASASLNGLLEQPRLRDREERSDGGTKLCKKKVTQSSI